MARREAAGRQKGSCGPVADTRHGRREKSVVGAAGSCVHANSAARRVVFAYCRLGHAAAARVLQPGLAITSRASGRPPPWRPLLGLSERRSGSTLGRSQSGCLLPSTSVPPGRSSGLRLAVRTLVVAQSDSLASGARAQRLPQVRRTTSHASRPGGRLRPGYQGGPATARTAPVGWSVVHALLAA
jgi:hypothetical protein